jgi:hypothetical protein
MDFLNPEDVYKKACLILEWHFEKHLRTVENNPHTDKTLVQVNQWKCDYYLNLPLDKYDIRAEGAEEGRLKLSLGGTNQESCDKTKISNGKIDTPYRDGAHLHWDSKHLNGLPMFVISEGKAQQIEARLS